MKKSELKALIKEVVEEAKAKNNYSSWKTEDLKDAILDPEVLVNHKSNILDELIRRAVEEALKKQREYDREVERMSWYDKR